MPGHIEVPERKLARTKEIELEVSTGEGDDEKQAKFTVELPLDIGSAVSLFGETDVFRRFINAHVVYLQGKERNKLSKDSKPRVRASYLESLGL